jgi:hypothetical protein
MKEQQQEQERQAEALLGVTRSYLQKPVDLASLEGLFTPGYAKNFEIAIRTIERALPYVPTKTLLHWKSMLATAQAKIQDELNSTLMHECGVCGFEEYGYRTELPIGWRERGDLVICFNHEDQEIADALKKSLAADQKQAEASVKDSLKELLSI